MAFSLTINTGQRVNSICLLSLSCTVCRFLFCRLCFSQSFSDSCLFWCQIKYKNSSLKSSENIQKKECGSDRSISDNRSSSVTLNKLAMKARKSYCNFKFKQRSHTMTEISFDFISSYVCSYYFWFGLGCWMNPSGKKLLAWLSIS